MLAAASGALQPRQTWRWDNAAAESFFATLETELLYRATWPTRQHARTAIFHYLEGFYNRHRAIPLSATEARSILRPTTRPLPLRPKKSVHRNGQDHPRSAFASVRNRATGSVDHFPLDSSERRFSRFPGAGRD